MTKTELMQKSQLELAELVLKYKGEVERILRFDLTRENLREWLDLYAHSIPKVNVEGLLIDAQNTIEQKQQTITELSTALDNVLNHRSIDTIVEDVVVLERVRGETK